MGSGEPRDERRAALRVRPRARRSRTHPGRRAEPLPVTTIELTVRTGRERGLFDLTADCAQFASEAAAGRDGLLNVFVPHATAGLVVVELGSGTERDLVDALDAMLPRDDRWRHRHGSPGHGADHVIPLLAGPSLSVPVVAGELTLGTWQSIALLDPNPDNGVRTVRLSFLAG